MTVLQRLAMWLEITGSHGIVRRYFVVNGFDGALTMLGIIMGFAVSAPADTGVVISACLGAAIALGVSGVSSAYVSEAAERRKALHDLEQAMVTTLEDSAHARAARLVPLLIAAVNGLAPLLISLLIISPLWLARAGLLLPFSPLHLSIGVALVVVFLLGVFLGRFSGVSWLRSGIQTLLIAGLTLALIYLVGGTG